MIIFFYSVWPLLLNRQGGLEVYFAESTLEFYSSLLLLLIVSLYFGMLSGRATSVVRNIDDAKFMKLLQSSTILRRRVYLTGLILGLVSIFAYLSLFKSFGHLIKSYSTGKGGGYAASGYIGEAVLLSFPAVVLIAVSVRARGKLKIADVLVSLFCLMPHIIQGTLGGRRGPLFLVLCISFFSLYMARRKQPSMKAALTAVTIAVLVIMAVAANRQHVYLGSEGSFEISRALATIVPEEVEAGNEYVSVIASMKTSDYFQDYYWGYRYFVIFFIRPIPRQFWPSKYEDVGAYWLNDVGDDSNYRTEQAVGFRSPGGVSAGSFADAYQEFWIFSVVFFFLLGRFFSFVWYKHRINGGIWTVLAISVLGLSVYLPSQSVSAWGVRLMFIFGGSMLMWKIMLGGYVAAANDPQKLDIGRATGLRHSRNVK